LSSSVKPKYTRFHTKPLTNCLTTTDGQHTNEAWQSSEAPCA